MRTGLLLQWNMWLMYGHQQWEAIICHIKAKHVQSDFRALKWMLEFVIWHPSMLWKVLFCHWTSYLILIFLQGHIFMFFFISPKYQTHAVSQMSQIRWCVFVSHIWEKPFCYENLSRHLRVNEHSLTKATALKHCLTSTKLGLFKCMNEFSNSNIAVIKLPTRLGLHMDKSIIPGYLRIGVRPL